MLSDLSDSELIEYSKLLLQKDIDEAKEHFWAFCKLLEPSFYKDSRPHLKKLCDTLEAFHYNNLKDKDGNTIYKLMIRLPPQHGKLLPSDTPILTTKGWKEHGKLNIGDLVFGQDGKHKKVLGNSGIYDWNVDKINFNDGNFILASKEHLWNLEIEYDDHKGRRNVIIETQNIFKRRNRRSPFINAAPALEMDEKELPIDPYLLGCWLGDGNAKDASICVGKEDINHFSKLGHTRKVRDGIFSVIAEGLYKKLRLNNLLKNKHIPDEYFLSSIKQRTELLQGLMDTDGCCDVRGNVEFCQKSGRLANDVYILIKTLGFKARKKEYDALLYGRFISKKTRILFNPNKTDKIFKIERKQFRVENKINSDRNDKYKYFIKNITPFGMVKGNCIEVEGGMYLAGLDLIPTHNSRSLVNFTKWSLGRNNEERIITASRSDSQAADFSRYTRDGINELKNLQSQIVFSDIFPKTKIKQGDGGVQKWALEGQHFNYLGVGVSGGVTGKGATLRIIDDIVKDAETALNDNALNKIWVWLSGTFSSRNSAEEGEVKEIFCATLWGENDPQAILEKTETNEWYILSMPIYDDTTDKMLCNDFMNKSQFMKLKHRMEIDSRTKMIFHANYLCVALTDNETKVLPLSSLKRYKEFPTNMGYFTVSAVDAADTGTDHFAMPICRVYGNRVYVIDAIFDNTGNLTTYYPETLGKIKEHKINNMYIETNSFGMWFKNHLLNERIPGLTVFGAPAKGQKMGRILANAGIIKYYFYFPENPNPTLQKFIDQCCKLMKTSTKEDDALDSLCSLAAYLEKFYNTFKE